MAQILLISICILHSAATEKRVYCVVILLNVLVRESARSVVGLMCLWCPSPHLWGCTEAEQLHTRGSEEAQPVGPGYSPGQSRAERGTGAVKAAVPHLGQG